MTPITDWKGNEIKEGMEVTIILVVKRDYMHNFVIWMPKGDYGHDEIRGKDKPDPDKECWETGELLKVSNKDGVLGCFRDVRFWESGDVTEFSTAHTFMTLSMLLPLQNTCIIAIKGISDKEDEYRNYKKQIL